MKFLTGILASLIICGTVSASTIGRSLVPALTAIASYTVEQVGNSATSLDWKADETPPVDWSLFEGMFLGLQVNSENTDHQCYQSLQAMKSDVKKLPEYVRAVTG
jgi:hypothetical protein